MKNDTGESAAMIPRWKVAPDGAAERMLDVSEHTHALCQSRCLWF